MTMAAMNIPVRFKGEDFVWIKGEDGCGALAPPHHVDATGNIKPEHCLSPSFAHIKHGRIYRFGCLIGHLDDLEDR